MTMKRTRPSAAVSVACFITPHGFGHAARTAGVLDAIGRRIPDCRMEIFTSLPEWFFVNSLQTIFAYHPVVTDVGFIQQSPLVVDHARTLGALQQFIPFEPAKVDALAELIQDLNCQAVICDIAPLGIAVANKSRIPSVLVENFTWDWLYADCAVADARMRPYVDIFAKLYSSASHHIQTEPVCRPHANAAKTRPVSRDIRTPPDRIRQRLNIPPNQKMVLVTMGGVPDAYDFFHALSKHRDVCFVLVGTRLSANRRENVIWLPRRSTYFHPDLVNAADLVVGKAGYSTLAEVYHAGVPFGYINRTHFREARVLGDFIDRHIPSSPIAAEDFYSGRWLEELPALVSLPRVQRDEPNGADQIAEMIRPILSP